MTGVSDTQRLFFALWPEVPERTALAAWQAPLQDLCGGRGMRSDTLHVTLAFLGAVPKQRLEALCLAAREVAFQPFGVCLDLARYWGHNHIVYATPSALPPALLHLVQDLQHSLRRHRFRFDDRQEYKPHVTLLRHANWTDVPLPLQPVVSWQVREFVLVRSASDEQGARYEVLARFRANVETA